MIHNKFTSGIVIGLILLLLGTVSLFAGLEAGKTPPAFKLPSLDGKEISLQDYLGKIVILHLWKCQ